MPAIQKDAAILNEYPEALEGEDDIANAFLEKPTPETEDDASDPKRKKPSEKGNEEDDNSSNEEQDDDEANDEDASDESPDDDDEGDEGEDENDDKAKDKKYAESDDIYVKVKVGDEEHEVPVKDLKRLFGQEAALTRKSQEVADERKAVEADRAKNIAGLDIMLKRASERANPYRQINWAALMKDPAVTADDVSALQAEAQRAFDDEQFLKTELDGFMTQVQEAQKAERGKSAQACIKALTTEDSPTFIKGWNETLYNDIRAFGVEMGLDKEMVNGLTDPAAFKMMHMAMQFKRGATKVQTTKVNKTPKKIVKTSASPSANKPPAKSVERKIANDRLKKTGSMDDAENAFLAMIAND